MGYFLRAERANLHITNQNNNGMLISGEVVYDLETLLESQIVLGSRQPALEAFYHRFQQSDVTRLTRRVDTYGLGITLFLLYVAMRLDVIRRRGSEPQHILRFGNDYFSWKQKRYFW